MIQRGQMRLRDFAKGDNVVVVAPTSYGKSELIIDKVVRNLDQRICVIVPTKALLAQTHKVLQDKLTALGEPTRVITHPDMYCDITTPFVAIFTQERLLKMLHKYQTLKFHKLLIDEAHNLLENKSRSKLMTQVILIAQRRNSSLATDFYSPFIVDVESMEIVNRPAGILKLDRPKEFMKSEQYCYIDLSTKTKKAKLYFYDQYLDKCWPVGNLSAINEIEFVITRKAKQNIVYLNKPKDVEVVAHRLADKNKSNIIKDKPNIMEKIKALEDLTHANFRLTLNMRQGVIYHHGSLPDFIRIFIEDIFRKHNQFEFLVTNSTMLEGVNIPAVRLFVLSASKGRGLMNAAQFKNLVGRICRLKDIFNLQEGGLNLLQPCIYLIKGEFSNASFAIDAYYSKTVKAGKQIKDEVDNPLLKNSKSQQDTDRELLYLENVEPGSSGLELADSEKANTHIGKLCFKYNVRAFDIIENEAILQDKLETYKHYDKIDTMDDLILMIYDVFLENTELHKSFYSIARLKSKEVRGYYSWFLDNKAKGQPYRQMISELVNYWDNREDKLVYVGPKWGEVGKELNSRRKYHVDIRTKTKSALITLAVARIKEEQDFVNFEIMPYLEILKELGKLEESFYDRIRFGTDDKKMITMFKNGLSHELATLIYDKYLLQVEIDTVKNLLTYDSSLIASMRSNNENQVLIFEAEYFANSHQI